MRDLFKVTILGSISLLSSTVQAQEVENFSFHFQNTIIDQYKPRFKAKYTGENSLTTVKENRNSITATAFLGARLWKNAEFYLNPELAGGEGLSSTLGVGDATNGETFRVGDHAPKIYLARIFYKQIVPLTSEKNYFGADLNQLSGFLPQKYFSITVGKVGLADYFDDNKFSHDPRTQFMSWGLMDNGAWDYAANTRGYTPSIILEYISPKSELRYGLSLIPTLANGNVMDRNISKARSQTIEYTKRYSVGSENGAIRLLTFYTDGKLGSYSESVALSPNNPEIERVRRYGHHKFGFGVNAEQDFTKFLGGFLRTSWNDGKYETWAFTEIDKSISFGLTMDGERWKRANDAFGIANVSSGLSKPHRAYLKAGGKGFMLGDGNLNYKPEDLTEVYYSSEIIKNQIFITGAYQLLFNPGYNHDRHGPVNILSLRIHTQI